MSMKNFQPVDPEALAPTPTPKQIVELKFDYDSLGYDQQTTDQLILNAQAIVAADRKVTAAVWEIGTALERQKNILRHGEWLRWLETETRYSQNLAQAMMRIARRLPQLPELERLSFRALLEVAATSPDEPQLIKITDAITKARKTPTAEEIKKMREREWEQAVWEDTHERAAPIPPPMSQAQKDAAAAADAEAIAAMLTTPASTSANSPIRRVTWTDVQPDVYEDESNQMRNNLEAAIATAKTMRGRGAPIAIANDFIRLAETLLSYIDN